MKVKLPVRREILERKTYEPPEEGRWGKIRLDFNENTAGCSRAVRRALAGLSEKQIAMYPEVLEGTAKLARHFGVAPEELVLTNGGDDDKFNPNNNKCDGQGDTKVRNEERQCMSCAAQEGHESCNCTAHDRIATTG